MSVCDSHNLKTTGPNLMKFDGMFDHGPRTTSFNFHDDPDPDPDSGSGFFFAHLVTFLKNYWVDLSENFTRGRSWSRDDSI